MDHRSRRREERVRWDEDVFARHVERAQNDLQGGRSGVYGDPVLYTAERGKLLLEGDTKSAEREPARGQDFLDAVCDPLTVFGKKIDLGRRDLVDIHLQSHLACSSFLRDT